MLKKLLSCLLVFGLSGLPLSAQDLTTTASPDGRESLQVARNANDDHTFTYRGPSGVLVVKATRKGRNVNIGKLRIVGSQVDKNRFAFIISLGAQREVVEIAVSDQGDLVDMVNAAGMADILAKFHKTRDGALTRDLNTYLNTNGMAARSGWEACMAAVANTIAASIAMVAACSQGNSPWLCASATLAYSSALYGQASACDSSMSDQEVCQACACCHFPY